MSKPPKYPLAKTAEATIPELPPGRRLGAESPQPFNGAAWKAFIESPLLARMKEHRKPGKKTREEKQQHENDKKELGELVSAISVDDVTNIIRSFLTRFKWLYDPLYWEKQRLAELSRELKRRRRKMTTISDNPNVQAHYEWLLDQGNTHLFAEMVALRSPPGTKVEAGNDTYFQGRHNNEDLDHEEPAWRELALRKAKEAGVSIGGKVYCHGLARYVGDPQGWVSDTSEIKSRCEANGWDCEGQVNYTAPVPAEPASQRRARKRIMRKLGMTQGRAAVGAR